VVIADDVERRVRHRFLAEPADLPPRERLVELLVQEDPLLGPAAAAAAARRLAGELVGLGPLQALLGDPEVTDVLANGAGPVWVERRGRLERTSVLVDDEQITRAVERLVAPLGLRADRAHPIVDARLDDGSRVAAVLPPLAVDGPVLAVRRHLRRPLPLEQFADPPVVQLLQSLVQRRCNVVVHGPTGAGKTSLVNALAAGLATEERVVTIEDVAELQLPGEHVVRLEARPGTADGVGRVGMRDLVRAALRLRPDRIVVGEVRGAEAAEMIWALSTGHRGGFSTCHAGSAEDALARLETMCSLALGNVAPEAVRAQVRSAVDVLVGVDREPDGRRRVVSVHPVDRRGIGAELCGGLR
jgi:pilus assembly protein CpaF